MLTLVRVQVQPQYNPKELSARFIHAAGIKEDTAPVSANMQPESAINNDKPVCPKCSGEMVLRTAKSGNNKGQQFWGCMNYPRCRTIYLLKADANRSSKKEAARLQGGQA